MTFYQKLEMLCRANGMTITTLTNELGFSSSAGTTWKKSKGLPRNSTLKKIADYFEISIDELEEGIDLPVDYDSVDTSTFNQQVWQHILEQNNYDEHKSIDAYLNFERAKMRDAFNGNVIKDNHGIIGNANAPVHINNAEVTLSAQETELINLFRKMSVIQQAQLLVNAAELLEK